MDYLDHRNCHCGQVVDLACCGCFTAEGPGRNLQRSHCPLTLLGLEILVAADIIPTVALQPTLANVAILALLVLIRTFLSWSLVVETEGRWPWHAPDHVEQEEV